MASAPPLSRAITPTEPRSAPSPSPPPAFPERLATSRSPASSVARSNRFFFHKRASHPARAFLFILRPPAHCTESHPGHSCPSVVKTPRLHVGSSIADVGGER